MVEVIDNQDRNVLIKNIVLELSEVPDEYLQTFTLSFILFVLIYQKKMKRLANR